MGRPRKQKLDSRAFSPSRNATTAAASPPGKARPATPPVRKTHAGSPPSVRKCRASPPAEKRPRPVSPCFVESNDQVRC